MWSGTTFVAALVGVATVKAIDLQELLNRPLRPLTTEIRVSCGVIRPSLFEISEAVSAMQAVKRAIQAERGETRSEIRQEVREVRDEKAAMRRELNESVEEAKQLAMENVRKLSEEMKEKGRGKER